ncbi:MAG: ubiquinol-cytochrome c reductase cytochrome b subunit, partial [Microbacterium sp.]
GYEPLVVRPNAKGRIPWTENLRSAVSRWFFEDRLAPLTQADIDAVDAHGAHASVEVESASTTDAVDNGNADRPAH